ncbi:hypothetical protein EO98_11390 [Methanosarcina sp. 2.H.T.1A.6]|nr:hypothetical protein EO94_12800 [Methanosarcina sp. 2.H.T.1A.3]KKG20564.1 hypothetical protein EO97_17050 [Methanosarcina sp. 2.H.T.1A.15]KKG23651.1 hypothetical protein EO98_11390 [Methanosarcina sp. 2.H.T.1A.6]KKG26951.1 hypothetical protein EO96_13645 [Methanosarcina sp. 2.H.T.1A.8]
MKERVRLVSWIKWIPIGSIILTFYCDLQFYNIIIYSFTIYSAVIRKLLCSSSAFLDGVVKNKLFYFFYIPL